MQGKKEKENNNNKKNLNGFGLETFFSFVLPATMTTTPTFTQKI